jgi:hypothetical protein
MRPLVGIALAVALLVPAALEAGQILGTIVLGGKGVKTKIEIKCGSDTTPGESAADGAYRVNVPQQGQCTLALPEYMGAPSSAIFSTPNPSTYNFELVQKPDGSYELRRR